MSNTKNQNKNSPHIPVLLSEVFTLLAPKSGEVYLDLTAGYGGHAKEIMGRTLQYQNSALVDRDENAIRHLKYSFSNEPVEIIKNDFLHAVKELRKQGRTFDIILADLGVSSPHLDDAERGFSYSNDGPLDMRMDTKSTLTAEKIVNNYSHTELERILHDYGEEPKARKIAELIVNNRPITSTTQLASVVARAWPGRSRHHPAMRTFQAIRIAVNDEINLLTETLKEAPYLLAPGGRLAIISFHSLEDRIVKHFFQELTGQGYESEFESLTKKPVTGSTQEIVYNPRARSAKLRVLTKIKT